MKSRRHKNIPPPPTHHHPPLNIGSTFKIEFCGSICGSPLITRWKKNSLNLKLIELSNITFFIRSYEDKKFQNKQVDYINDQLLYLTSKNFFEYVINLAGKLQMFLIHRNKSDCSTFKT